MSLAILPFFEPDSSTWTYLVADSVAGRAAVVDPVWVYDPVTGRADGAFTGKVLDESAARGWQVDWVLETHVHADHLTAAALVRERTGARLAIGRGVCASQQCFRRVYHLPRLAVDGSQFDLLVADGDELELGGLTVRVLETPGHTRDSVSFVVNDAAFIGDTLFAPGLGSARCDFPGGNAGQLFDSIQRLHDLPGDTRLYLCHDYPHEGQEPRCMVRVEESLHENVHVPAGTDREAFIRMRETRDAGLSMPRLMLPAVQVNIRGGLPPQPEANGVSYLKTPFNVSLGALQDDDGDRG